MWSFCQDNKKINIWLSQSREEGVVRRVKAMEMCPENQRLA
jgi:hypothetical protein